MKVRNYLFICLVFVVFVCPLVVFSSDLPRIGVRGGFGTDANLGLAVGGGANYMLDNIGNSPLELGVVIYYSHSTETSNNGFNDYHETTNITVYGMMANYLMGYEFGKPGGFLIAGFGVGAVTLYWEEWSPTDESLGELLPGGGSRHDMDGSGAGSVFNLGGGMAFSNGADIRLEVPVIVAFDPPEDASGVAFALTISAGMRF
jgi:hypothetical protein